MIEKLGFGMTMKKFLIVIVVLLYISFIILIVTNHLIGAWALSTVIFPPAIVQIASNLGLYKDSLLNYLLTTIAVALTGIEILKLALN